MNNNVLYELLSEIKSHIKATDKLILLMEHKLRNMEHVMKLSQQISMNEDKPVYEEQRKPETADENDMKTYKSVDANVVDNNHANNRNDNAIDAKNAEAANVDNASAKSTYSSYADDIQQDFHDHSFIRHSSIKAKLHALRSKY